MKHSLRSRIIFDLRRNRAAYLTLFLLILAGVAVGYRCYWQMEPQHQEGLKSYVWAVTGEIAAGGLDRWACVLNTLWPILIYFVLLVLCALHAAALPVTGAAFLVKGFLSGFFLATILNLGFFKSLLFVLGTVLPKTAYLLLLIKAGSSSAANGIHLFKQRRLINSFSTRLTMSVPMVTVIMQCAVMTVPFVLFETFASTWLVSLV